jgi:nucleoside-diphosphate-sugar epimerase
MKALVTGANGFIGSHLVEALCAANVEVRCLVRSGSDLRWLQGSRVEHAQGDCRDRDSLREAVRNVDVVFHLAGLVRAKSYRDYFEVNSLGTRNLIDACLACNPDLKRFVLVSSQAVAGPSPDGRKVSERDAARPISAYGWSKLMAEREVLSERGRIPVVVLRPAPVYGPRDTEFHTLFRLIQFGLRPVLGNQKRYLNLIFVRDLVDGCLLAMVKPAACGQTYFLAEDRTYSWEDVGHIIGIASRRKTRQVRIPTNFGHTIARLAELLAGFCGRTATINREKAREMLARYWLCDTALVRRELGFETSTPLRLGAEDTYLWYRNHGWL